MRVFLGLALAVIVAVVGVMALAVLWAVLGAPLFAVIVGAFSS